MEENGRSPTPESTAVDSATITMRELAIRVLDKYPDFDPKWSEETQTSWLEGMTSFKRRSTSATNRLASRYKAKTLSIDDIRSADEEPTRTEIVTNRRMILPRMRRKMWHLAEQTSRHR